MLTPLRIIRLAAVLLPLTLTAADVRAEAQPGIDSLQDSRAHTREDFVHGMASMTLAILQDHKKPYSERRMVLRRAFNTVVDIPWIARFVLGRSWSVASDEQRDRYTSLYQTFLTESYVSNFAEDPEKRIKDINILGIQDAPEHGFIVNTNVLLANRDELRVDYRVSDNNDRYKVIDIVIENVSLLNTHRAQFSELASNRGIEGVITSLSHINAGHDRASISVSMK
jgi:phospholipid transport system substrate-binding protein